MVPVSNFKKLEFEMPRTNTPITEAMSKMSTTLAEVEEMEGLHLDDDGQYVDMADQPCDPLRRIDRWLH